MTDATSPAPDKAELYDRLGGLTISEERRFRRRLKKARRPQALAAIGEDLEAALAANEARVAALPKVSYPEDLPVAEHADDLKEAIADNQVVIVAGETGSGKTTQLPKMLLELGLARRGIIGHTQPRRIAARSVAERIASELGTEVGSAVGYAIRFDDKVSDSTAIKLMTDGILLAEMKRDRRLERYSAIIIDEAHERSLNIDFLLGYLKRLLPERPDLKVIITSATIDPESFARHFADSDGEPAPVVEVSGRTYPVEVRYRPLEAEEPSGRLVQVEQQEGVLAAVKELMAEGKGDILCFFASEREIRETMDHLSKKLGRGVELVPLFGRLSNQEQHRVFSPHSGRRIVLATNIAETSLTVPGIHYVVDTGTARISRYSTRTKVQRLPIEPVSQASANQRSGRSGRIAPGVAIRLYSEEDFDSRPKFTDPEIRRTNLASVILQMALLLLGDIREFPFVDPPEARAIKDGLTLLTELGAITAPDAADVRLTGVGRDIARLPVDPKMARMLVEAHRRLVLEPVTVIVAALSIQDIRERPLEQQARADQLHARFKNTASDFLSYLGLWDYLAEQRKNRSGNGLKRMMKEEFLHYVRYREWRDLVRQLRGATRDLGWEGTGTADNDGRRDADRDAIHQSLLSGLLPQIAVRDGNSKDYQGARGSKLRIFPGSGVAKKTPEMIMAAELVDTSRLWAREVAAIRPQWVEELGGELLKRHFGEAFWSRKRGQAMVHMSITLYGLTIVADRTVSLHPHDPELARDMFLRHALVGGDWDAHHEFLSHNRRLLEEAADVEDKARRRGIVADEDALFEFYDRRVPASVTRASEFDKWWKKERKNNPGLLDFSLDELLDSDEAGAVTAADFPDAWPVGDRRLALSYSFEPGAATDGVAVEVPVPMLASLDPAPFRWLVPGLREELFTELIRSLPKGLRRGVVPAPDFDARALEIATPDDGSPEEALAAALKRLGAAGIDASDFRPEKLPAHLKMTFSAVNKKGRVVDSDKDLAALKDRQSGQITRSVSRLAGGEEANAKEWTNDTLGEIKEEVTTRVDGHDIAGYPTLLVTEKGVARKVMPTRREAEARLTASTLTLLLRDVTVKTPQLVKGLPLQQRVAVDNYPHGGADALAEDARVAATRDLLNALGGPERTPAGFEKLKAEVRGRAPGEARKMIVALAPALVAYDRVSREISGRSGEAIDDIKAQLEFLLPTNALVVHGIERLKHLPRYLQAIEVRLGDMRLDPDRDLDRQDEVQALEDELAAAAKKKKLGPRNPKVAAIAWQLQELRVSLFAQRLGTAQTVSVQRVRKAIGKL
ncbi:ATP-dependent RNA helicase HrpA [Corynebacterium otitidis]|uniref:ATP-dependent helicase HrpA n=1 Tax=Corynebacterium otitidis ATCC 51513 TaxID=883169 RepID=I7IWQ9_9CORY|nr:ATP-dependent RNA helicase HrpA [Corynebacterium otitidis]EJZ83012.1 ATP-dependent helicase HrpA [Corynebacterium otitidis ATCC 51513]CCI83173.1 ATP-dependent helicase HrpA [Corynebacterium otitidis ATCC 51513]